MKFATYIYDSKECIGVLSNSRDQIYPINENGLAYKSMTDLIENITKEEKQKLEEELETKGCGGLPIDQVQLLAQFQSQGI